MARVVWKFPLESETIIDLPRDAQVRLAGLDPAGGRCCLWIELNPDAPREPRFFALYGTGQEIDGDFPSPMHVGSIIDRPFVWHVYEDRRAK